MQPVEDENEENHPQVEAAHGDGSDGTKPPRPTAVGTGDSDDDIEEKISELRRCDLDELDDSQINVTEILSWPIPELTFVKIEGILRSSEMEQEERLRAGLTNNTQLSNAFPKRRYLMEDALTGLSGSKTYVAFLMLGSKNETNYFLGISLQQAPKDLDNDALARVNHNIQRSILHSVYDGIDINSTIFWPNDLRTMIEATASNVGIVTGIASLKGVCFEESQAEQLEQIATGMQGSAFGMLILASPIPMRMVDDEEITILDNLKKTEEIENGKNKQRVKYYVELENAYLKQVQYGQSVGHWPASMYFFAEDDSAFARLRSLIKTTYEGDASGPMPLRCHMNNAFRDHLLSFGLLRNCRSKESMYALSNYKFLTPINSRTLSAYIHLPKRDMPGFKVRRA